MMSEAGVYSNLHPYISTLTTAAVVLAGTEGCFRMQDVYFSGGGRQINLDLGRQHLPQNKKSAHSSLSHLRGVLLSVR